MTPTLKLLLIVSAVLIVALVPLAPLPVAAAAGLAKSGPWALGLLGLAVLGMTLHRGPDVRDNALLTEEACPNGAATTTTDGFDLGHSTNGSPPANIELVITAPDLATGLLPDAQTLKYEVFHDTAVAFGSEVSLYGIVLTQTGANNSGADAAEKRVALPSDCGRYVRVKCTKSGAGDASAATFTVEIRT